MTAVKVDADGFHEYASEVSVLAGGEEEFELLVSDLTAEDSAGGADDADVADGPAGPAGGEPAGSSSSSHSNSPMTSSQSISVKSVSSQQSNRLKSIFSISVTSQSQWSAGNSTTSSQSHCEGSVIPCFSEDIIAGLSSCKASEGIAIGISITAVTAGIKSP
ncbi:expressed protein [Batrachochytrium dendrobatidis JAM81]|uniref:Expressed protein n=1 Tax=Batrachochytrium dendrobatidis (strain JAM81 / FGSC 10211) TaxID=684364 RepID=F4P7A2_BATDJ|nr:uncharacterized protein BATDEDRAFT_37170 [Batrachochytrium dendrobatidis JAM81]EGF78849.1 expressed protein [Batrachochytrium dendrobatidis JAM81]|eukprot:XP_006680439.1 expressed protein [Batrachochytrium dendrobatidis JAM81]